ncbi:mannitol dehydrogenase [Spirochaetia bacterium]|nr:mannitol dehydrogenase [Spirochaetia bacterium]
MRLRDIYSDSVNDRTVWGKAGIELPRFDRASMIKATEAAPEWVHFGAGNIFRIFPAALQQDLLERGIEKTGIIMVAGRDGGIVDEVFKPCDNLTLGVTLKADGGIAKKVIAGIAASLWMGKDEDFEKLKNIFRKPSLKMASFTITEKAYNLNGGPDPEHYLAKVTALLYERYKAGSFPLALVSMDNCSHNGDKLFSAVEAFALSFIETGRAEKEFIDYIRDPKKVSFPWTMIDKITPGPDQGVKTLLEKSGFEDTKIYAKTTPTAPFVNAEETQYLVMEDSFPGGRAKLEEAGVLFCSRETVEKAERMKVSTCLNPLHTALAIFGCLLGYTKICDEMKNKDLVKMIEIIGYVEGLPAAADPGIITPKKFIDEVVKVRLPNPFLPDTPQRIASDSSQKIPIRFGETIKTYQSNKNLDINSLKIIPLVLAAWVRYLLGINDEGKPFTVSPDPLYETLAAQLSGIKPGDKGPFHKVLEPIFSNEKIFGVDLYQAGLGKKAEAYFEELMAGPGAVAATLKRYL